MPRSSPPEGAWWRSLVGQLYGEHAVAAKRAHTLSKPAPGDQEPVALLADGPQRLDLAHCFRPGPIPIPEPHQPACPERGGECRQHRHVVSWLEQVHPRSERRGSSSVRVRHHCENLPNGRPGGLPKRPAPECPEPDQHSKCLVEREPGRAEGRRGVDGVAASSTLLRPDRRTRLLQREKIALDRPDRHLEPLREPSGAARPGRHRTEFFDQSVEAVRPVHLLIILPRNRFSVQGHVPRSSPPPASAHVTADVPTQPTPGTELPRHRAG
jgi:hypothetical protein